MGPKSQIVGELKRFICDLGPVKRRRGVKTGTGGDIQPSKRDYEPYNDKDFPVDCPKCRSHNIWYIPGMFGIEDLDEYWCRDCDNKFNYGEMPFHGASGDW